MLYKHFWTLIKMRSPNSGRCTNAQNVRNFFYFIFCLFVRHWKMATRILFLCSHDCLSLSVCFFLRFISLSKRTSNENLMKQKMLLPQWCLQKSSNRFLLIFDEINISEEQTFLAFAAFVLVVRFFQNRTFSFWIDWIEWADTKPFFLTSFELIRDIKGTDGELNRKKLTTLFA